MLAEEAGEVFQGVIEINLIRLLMAQAAAARDVEPRQLSVKHTEQLWTEWTARQLTHCTARQNAELWQLIASPE